MLINKQYKGSFQEFEPVTECIMVVRMSVKPVDLIMVQCYAPIPAADDVEKQDYNEALERTIQKWRRKGMLIAMGDFNAQIGQGHEGNIMGKYVLGARNEGGQILVDFC